MLLTFTILSISKNHLHFVFRVHILITLVIYVTHHDTERHNL